jgi:hypothetical protein
METIIMPESITAMRATTYNVEQIIQDIAEVEERPIESVTLDEVMDRIADYATEDLASSRNVIIYQDQDGGEIEL